ncbi:MAG TPA: PP2C family protein-serine/threonine phosphatase, partial [Ignavibacteriaceae bacterium]|nr:PP2C family protein-serine/threonine phosphatase [Ignavibacteriaceae bacterium]
RVDPLVRVCLGDLNKIQQRILEEDLTLASKLQTMLLPRNDFSYNSWNIYYHYEPAGLVSGDYCDLISTNGKAGGEFYFILGDVSGKGVAASMLMTHMHAMFHSLIEFDLPLNALVSKVNKLLCESTLSTHFTTLVCGKAHSNGEVEICNAGHCFPVIISRDNITEIPSTGLPLGLFADQEYSVCKYHLKGGDSIFLYTDGLSESRKEEIEYGTERITQLAAGLYGKSSGVCVNTYLNDVKSFLSGANKIDDLTLMVINRLNG